MILPGVAIFSKGCYAHTHLVSPPRAGRDFQFLQLQTSNHLSAAITTIQEFGKLMKMVASSHFLSGPSVIILLCAAAMSFYSIISNLPRIFMHFILQFLVKENKCWNSVTHWNKMTHRDRQIVIPCPDLLYSTVPLDLTDPSVALLFVAPCTYYGSLGIYDDGAKCTEILSHSGRILRVIVIGPSVVSSDEDVKSSLCEPDPTTEVVRLNSGRGLLLHRLLMTRPEDYKDFRESQVHNITCSMRRLGTDVLISPRASNSVFYGPVCGPCLATVMCAVAKLSFLRSNHLDEVITIVGLSVGLGILTGLVGACVMVKLLKQPKFIVWTNMMQLHRWGGWSFNILTAGPGKPAAPVTACDSSMQSLLRALVTWGEPFVHLAFFLHGALGLWPTEVQYGNALSAVSGEGNKEVPLRNGESFVIEVPTLDLNCEW